jgi:hypothetical protein
MRPLNRLTARPKGGTSRIDERVCREARQGCDRKPAHLAHGPQPLAGYSSEANDGRASASLPASAEGLEFSGSGAVSRWHRSRCVEIRIEVEIGPGGDQHCVCRSPHAALPTRLVAMLDRAQLSFIFSSGEASTNGPMRLNMARTATLTDSPHRFFSAGLRLSQSGSIPPSSAHLV